MKCKMTLLKCLFGRVAHVWHRCVFWLFAQFQRGGPRWLRLLAALGVNVTCRDAATGQLESEATTSTARPQPSSPDPFTLLSSCHDPTYPPAPIRWQDVASTHNTTLARSSPARSPQPRLSSSTTIPTSSNRSLLLAALPRRPNHDTCTIACSSPRAARTYGPRRASRRPEAAQELYCWP